MFSFLNGLVALSLSLQCHIQVPKILTNIFKFANKFSNANLIVCTGDFGLLIANLMKTNWWLHDLTWHEIIFILHVPGDKVEITRLNRPEGRIFDWLYEPMCIMKEQISSLKLDESEELYFYKHCLYGGDENRIKTWLNGGTPPSDEIKRAQLEGISRRYC